MVIYVQKRNISVRVSLYIARVKTFPYVIPDDIVCITNKFAVRFWSSTDAPLIVRAAPRRRPSLR